MTLETYNAGFKMKFTKDVTKQQYATLFELLTTKMNELYNDTKKVTIKNDNSADGGFYFSNYVEPQAKSLNYKLKLTIHQNIKITVPDDLSEWENNTDILVKEKTVGTTFLKALNGADIWTFNELKVFKACFETIGVTCCCFPAVKSLSMVKKD